MTSSHVMDDNIRVADELIRQAASQGAEFILTPEMTTLLDFESKKVSDADKIIENLKFNQAGKQAIVPVVTVSNVNGHYIDVCKKVMHKLEPRDIWNQDSIILVNSCCS